MITKVDEEGRRILSGICRYNIGRVQFNDIVRRAICLRSLSNFGQYLKKYRCSRIENQGLFPRTLPYF